MQVLGPDEGALPEIPPAPVHEHLLYESPLILTAAFGLIAFILLVAAMRSSKRTPLVIGAIVSALLAGAVPLLAQRVVTEREVLEAKTEALIASIATSDRNALQNLLAESASLRSSENATGIAARFIPTIRGRDAIWSEVERRLGRTGSFVKEHKILETRPAIEGDNTGRVLVRVRVVAADDAFTNHSWWDVTWKRSGDDWLTTRVEAIWIQGY